jgi:hypothetical protein
MFEREFASEFAPRAGRPSRGQFRGVWHAGSERVVGTIRELSVAIEPGRPGEVIGRDIAEFNAALFEVYKRSSSAGAIFTLHFEAFADDQLSRQYMLALRQTPARLLPFVTPRLVDIDPEAPARLVDTRVRQLQSLFRKVIVETRGDNDVERFTHLRNATIETAWSTISRAADAVEAARRFQARVKEADLTSLMTGVDCCESFAAAVAAGIDTIAGCRIGCFERPLAEQYGLSRRQIADGD